MSNLRMTSHSAPSNPHSNTANGADEWSFDQFYPRLNHEFDTLSAHDNNQTLLPPLLTSPRGPDLQQPLEEISWPSLEFPSPSYLDTTAALQASLPSISDSNMVEDSKQIARAIVLTPQEHILQMEQPPRRFPNHRRSIPISSSHRSEATDFDWSFIRDPERRRKIVRWKRKREKFLRGKTKRHVYDVRVHYAALRPRVGGRFAFNEEHQSEEETKPEPDSE